MAILNKFIVGACALASIAHARPLAQDAPVVVTVTDVTTVTQTAIEYINAVSTVFLPASASTATATSSSKAEQTASAAVQLQQAVGPAPVSVIAPSSPLPSTFKTSTSSVSAVPRAPAPSAVAGGQCEGAGATCTGDVTHWDGGLGACGWDVNTNTDMQIALPVGLMGSQSNGNPYCGRSVTLKDPATGITVQATVGDKCMGCVGTAIDCTSTLFNAITGGKGDGRESGIQWWFN